MSDPSKVFQATAITNHITPLIILMLDTIFWVGFCTIHGVKSHNTFETYNEFSMWIIWHQQFCVSISLFQLCHSLVPKHFFRHFKEDIIFLFCTSSCMYLCLCPPSVYLSAFILRCTLTALQFCTTNFYFSVLGLSP